MAARCVPFNRKDWPWRPAVDHAGGACALNFNTQSRTICEVTLPTAAACVWVPPIVDRSQRQ